ncbi:MAG: S-layer homology domain-containing protein, partial [Oscillospiraceae bacterium]|nr:S-layer homology domain-containing protein [Oscillospiraceae bacterium]
PASACIRAQVVTFLWRAAGAPEPSITSNPFEDVLETDYFYKAVLWAYEKGITAGVDDTHFGPAQPCSRAQVVTFLWRAAGAPEASAESAFTDVTDPDAFYYDAVLWAVENGITAGMGDGTFGINAVCNRAQIVTFLYRVYAV